MKCTHSLLRVVAAALVLVVGVAAQSNGGFESGLSQWQSVPASATTISSTPSLFFPSEGNQYAIVSAAASSGGLAGHGPFSAGTGFGFASILSRTFTRPAASRCIVSLDWTFVLREAPLDPLRNDFMSINVLDASNGSLIKNIVFADNGFTQGMPAYGGVPGAITGNINYVRSLPNTPITVVGQSNPRYEVGPSGWKRVAADLSALTTPGQALLLQIVVANGGDDEDDSFAYIDNFEVRSGEANTNAASLRVVGGGGEGFVGPTFEMSDPFLRGAPYTQLLMPGSDATIALASFPGAVPFGLFAGTFKPDATVTPLGDLNLVQSAPIEVLVDGLNPSSFLEAALGTIGINPKYLGVTVPDVANDLELGIQAAVADPASPPFFLRLTAATELDIKVSPEIPLGTQPVLRTDGQPLDNNDFGIIDLSGLNGGAGFPFYGISYTECFVSDNGNVTFGFNDFSPPGEGVAFSIGPPRIAPFWKDLDPGGAGTVRMASNGTGGLFPLSPTKIVLSWEDQSPPFEIAGGTTFSLVLYEDGTIEFHYASVATSDLLIGISPGGVTTPVSIVSEARFSQASALHFGNTFITPPMLPIFENFGERNDLLSLGGNGRATLSFTPFGADYRAFGSTGDD